MKISLNKEYAIRHLGVAALFTGLSLYFLYDAIFVYPYLPADGAHHTTVEFQYSAAAALAIFAFVVAFRVFLNWRATLAWDDEQMTGTLTGGAPSASSVPTAASISSVAVRRARLRAISSATGRMRTSAAV